MTVEPLLADSRAKLRAALELVFASAADFVPFEPGRPGASSTRFNWKQGIRQPLPGDSVPAEVLALIRALSPAQGRATCS